jgi:hypothetical protein
MTTFVVDGVFVNIVVLKGKNYFSWLLNAHGLMTLGTLKCMRLSHQYTRLVLLWKLPVYVQQEDFIFKISHHFILHITQIRSNTHLYNSLLYYFLKSFIHLRFSVPSGISPCRLEKNYAVISCFTGLI